MTRDYSTKNGKATAVMVVRPGRSYGDAKGGERVRIDRDELRRGPTAETLYTLEEHAEALRRAEEARKAARRPKPNPVGDAIRAQLDRVWSGR